MSADHDTAAVLTEAERGEIWVRMLWPEGDTSAVPNTNLDGVLSAAMPGVVIAVERILAARLAAQPPQDDPQPDEREALAWAIHRACGCDGSCRPDPEDEGAADAVLAAGFRRDPDAGLRERIEAVLSGPRHRWWHTGGTQCSPLYAIRDALAEPTQAQP